MKSFALLLCGLSMAVATAPRATASAEQSMDTNAASSQAKRPSPAQSGFTDAGLKEFAALEPIDIHGHILRSDPAFSAMLEKLHLHLLDILVVDVKDDPNHRLLEAQKKDAWQFVSSNPGRVSLSTNFDPFTWNDPGFPDSAIADLNKDFAQGAIAATIWTNNGMQLKDASGKPALPDDPRLEPIYKDIARQHKTFIAHLTGADELWTPDAATNPTSNGSAILQARDHILQMNPDLRVIGAHLGSSKESIDQIALRLERYPNFAVDTSGRIDALISMPRDQALAFLLKFQDRILYGSDLGFREPDGSPADVVAKWQSRLALDWRLLASDDTFEYKGHEVHGLHLPPSVLRKLYHDNAVHWVPGIAQ
jgi:predicted TIM-barrel fold metal-dependent hydrolase